MTAHIRIDDREVAWIDETNTKVIEVALDMIAHGWSPEEIHFQHAHLSLAQIHAALGYYYDHQTEMDADVQRSNQEARKLRTQAGESPIRKRLREMGWKDGKSLQYFVDAKPLSHDELAPFGLGADKVKEAQRSQHNELYWRLRVWRALTFLFPRGA